MTFLEFLDHHIVWLSICVFGVLMIGYMIWEDRDRSINRWVGPDKWCRVEPSTSAWAGSIPCDTCKSYRLPGKPCLPCLEKVLRPL